MVKRRTAKGRLNGSIKRIWSWCRRARHLPLKEQHRELCRKIIGHYAYYGITGNAGALRKYRQRVIFSWRYWLGRRSQRARLTWVRFLELLRIFPVPKVRIVHSIYGRQLPLPSVVNP